ncbi:single-stranded-DNA-specific exonuclease RecJ [Comamonas thiooxydans]|uniref:single-stranded-DNA-specific exonuclease RecJ n=1 Tax=Comamonas thiooxydans TaxID=363952 RepID=UPI0011855B9C|nr:DHHA1 domain-containing protein [Comamonas thiooxydans]
MTATQPSAPSIAQRKYRPAQALALSRAGFTPLMARILASRDLPCRDDLGDGTLKGLLHHSTLGGTQAAAKLLADRIHSGKKMLVVADYDCDGATACAVALRGLKGFGADINFIVPDRMIHGYGLTPSVVELAQARFPGTEVLITVDNGVASHAGVEAAVAAGLEVLVTDHHLPRKNYPLPPAIAIVDPSLEGEQFSSKALAGVGVIWYVLWALQDEFKARGWKPATPGFMVGQLLPLVAVGTVADVVPLDRNNRILVQAGLARIRRGEGFVGINELATVGVINRTDVAELVTSDIAFGIGPRINAAGRLETMDLGIECLTTDDPVRAAELAQQLNEINSQRKELEWDTVVGAVAQAEQQIEEGTLSISVHDESWHAGVIGIVAGRIKERRYRPTFVLTTDSKTGAVKGSGRSIPGFNLKDALDQVDKQCPGLMPKFGGHAMAAGVTLSPGGFGAFKKAFEDQAQIWLTPEILDQCVEHDGSLSGPELCVATANDIRQAPWGQLFPEPSFCDYFNVIEAKVAGVHKDQLNLVVERDGLVLKATKFRFEGEIPSGMTQLVYKLNIAKNKFNKQELKLLIDSIL